VIARIWHGWTTRENAEKYEKLLREEVLLEIAQRSMIATLPNRPT
jgi:hypothetical protein